MQVRRPRRERGVEVECSSCGASDAIRIRLRLNDETEVNFSSCHRCEHRWWDSNGEVVDLTTVLDKARA